MTTPEENKELTRRLNAMWEGDTGVIDELVAEDFVNHNPLVPGTPPGPEGFKRNVSMVRTAFPDIEFIVENVIAEEDMLAFRTVGQGTHDGEFMGLEPTGREVTLSGIVMLRFEDGQLVERWGQFDTLGLLQQLGAVPAPGDLPATDS